MPRKARPVGHGCRIPGRSRATTHGLRVYPFLITHEPLFTVSPPLLLAHVCGQPTLVYLEVSPQQKVQQGKWRKNRFGKLQQCLAWPKFKPQINAIATGENALDLTAFSK